MAKIIYKEGFEGQNRLECIEGIEIELLNGYKALAFPKYKARTLLDMERTGEWKTSGLTEIKALKIVDGKELTDELLKLDSPAAKFVRQFKSHIRGDFDLPTLLAAGEIVYQKKDIDALAETIEGADLLSNNCSFLWSCCRGSSSYAWLASGGGFFYSGTLCVELSAVPVSLYR